MSTPFSAGDAYGPGDFKHPGLSEPRTKEEWREYLDYQLPPRPALLPPEVYERLSAKERHLHNQARAAHHSALIIVRTSQMKTIHHQIRRRMMTNAHQPAGARRSIVLDGPATLGKSTLVKTFAYDFEHELRGTYPERFGNQYIVDDHLIDYTPVVYINIPSQATPKDLSIALAQYLGQRYRSGATKSDITRLVLEKMRMVGVELVIIDDAHFMDLSFKEGKVVNDHLKYIANHTAALHRSRSRAFRPLPRRHRWCPCHPDRGPQHPAAHDRVRHPHQGGKGRLGLRHHRDGGGTRLVQTPARHPHGRVGVSVQAHWRKHQLPG
ncbi:AAA family ATPase [Streptomyces microflavus]|uniref:AAA family ATPase n=1 Tax=Streptomyces microflavus TaxID=1919 RepID=A0A7H8MNP0_STRMI|nr:AAA family ATPase [Streptomyces microflavus]